MPNPITSKDLYQNTGELDLLRTQLVGINEAIAAVLSNADNLQKIMRTLSGGKIGDQREIVKLAAELERLKKRKEELLQAEQRTQQAIYRTATAMNTEAASAQKAAIQHQKLRTAYNQTQLSAKRLEEQMKRTTHETKRSSTSFTGLLGTLRTLAYTYFSLAAAQRVVGKFFEQTKAINTLDIAYQKVFGSTKRVSEAQEYLRGVTERLGLDYLTTADAYLKFGAAAKQANIPAEQTNQIFESVSKAAAFLGLSTERVQLVFLALEQIISKGKLQTEELRRQLGEHLPGAFGIAAEAMGVTAGELTDLLKKGKIYSNEFLPKFAKQLEKAYGLENARRVDNLAAAQARFGNAFTDMVRKLDAAGVFKDFFVSLTKILKVVSDNINVFIALGKAVIKIGIAILSYKLGVGAASLATRLLKGEIISLTAVLEANPFGILAFAIIQLLPYMTRLYDSMRGISRAAKDAADDLRTMQNSVIDENQELKKLIDVYRDVYATQTQRNAAMEQLRDLYPKILAKYDLEKASLQDLINLQNELKDATIDRIVEQAKAEAKSKLLKDLQEAKKAKADNLERDIVGGLIPGLRGLIPGDTDAKARTRASNEAKQYYRDYISLVDQAGKEVDVFLTDLLEKQNAVIKSQDAFFPIFIDEQAAITEANRLRVEYTKELNKLSDEDLLREAKALSNDQLRKNIALDILRIRQAAKKQKEDEDGGDPDASFRKEIARRKKLNDFLNEGMKKELEALKIRYDEELHFNELGQKGIVLLTNRYEEERRDIVFKWRNKTEADIISIMASGQDKELAELKNRFELLYDENKNNSTALVALTRQEADERADILNKYIDLREEAELEIRDRTLQIEEEKFNTIQELFKAQSESIYLTSKQRDQIQLLQDIQALEERKRLARQGLIYLSDLELDSINTQINAKKQAFREGEIEIGLDRANLELDANNASIDATVKNEDYKKKLKLKALIEYWESVLKLDTRLSDTEKGIIRDTIQSIRNEINDIGAGKRSLFDLLFANMDDRQREALKQSLEYALQYTTEYFNNIEALYDRAVETSQRFLDQKQKEYDDQLALQQAGHANNVEQAKKDLALAKQKNEQALKDQERFQKAQLVANTALEASNLAVGLSKIVKDLGPLAPFAIGAVLATFIAAKITAFRAARKTFRKGGYEEIEGGSHESGRDTPVGTLSDGSVGYAEKGESVGIFTAKATRKYKPALKQLVDMANRGTLDRIMRQAEFANFPAIQAQMINTRGVEDRLDTLIEQGGDRSYLDSHGNTVIINRGRKTIIRK